MTQYWSTNTPYSHQYSTHKKKLFRSNTYDIFSMFFNMMYHDSFINYFKIRFVALPSYNILLSKQVAPHDFHAP